MILFEEFPSPTMPVDNEFTSKGATPNTKMNKL